LSLKFLKYGLVLILPISAWLSFSSMGWITFLPFVLVFVFFPLLELIIGAENKVLSRLELEFVSNDRMYDYLLYAQVPIQWFSLIFFLWSVSTQDLSWIELTGRTTSMGILCGVIGVNVAHELGHRTSNSERFLAKALLASTSFLHFYIEHNRGHHRNVGTDIDPASARKGESLYAFWLRTVRDSFKSAWHIVALQRKRAKKKVWSLQNEMIQYLLIEFLILTIILVLAGWMALILFLACSLTGILLLESINYIEHYGLRRSKWSEHRYEDVQPVHCWNSNHALSRLVLFELTRHSDHHMFPQKKYQLLENTETFPQLPTGYAGMIIVSFIPPLWRRLMDHRIEGT